MEYPILGRSGLRVSPRCLGGLMFATGAATAAARAPEQGGNFVDTADGSDAGRSEAIAGSAIRDHRSWWVLATKYANPTGPGLVWSRAGTCSTPSRPA